MAVPVVESVTTTSISGVNATFNMPATRPDGDLYVLVVGNDDFNDPDGMSEPTGWNRVILTQNPAADTLGGLVAWRIGDTEPATYDITSLSTFEGGAVVIRVSGTDATTPIDVSGSDTADTGTSVTAPDVTTTVVETLLLRLFQSDGSTFSAIPATQIYDFAPTTSSSPMAGSSETGPDPAGSTGTSSATLSADDNWIAFTVAVAPPGTTFTPVSLYATADGTITDVVDEADASTGLFDSVSDDPASPDDTDWVNNAVEVV